MDLPISCNEFVKIFVQKIPEFVGVFPCALGFKLPSGGLDSRKGEIRTLAQDLVREAQFLSRVQVRK